LRASGDNVVRAEKIGRCRPDFAKELTGTAVIRLNASFAIDNTGDCRVLELAKEQGTPQNITRRSAPARAVVP
jgi:hypothetical protein